MVETLHTTSHEYKEYMDAFFESKSINGYMVVDVVHYTDYYNESNKVYVDIELSRIN